MSAVAARLRAWSARHPRVYWAAVVVALIWSVGTWSSVNDDARNRRDSWGESVDVWVATSDHAIGQPLRAEHVLVPRAVVPADSVGTSPVGRPTLRVLRRGEIVLDVDVEPTAVAEAIAQGDVALTVRPEPPGPFAVGDAIVVLSPPEEAIDGRVIAVGDEGITISIPLDLAAVVSRAITDGTVVVALAGGDG
jgi:hypothetical protein